MVESVQEGEGGGGEEGARERKETYKWATVAPTRLRSARQPPTRLTHGIHNITFKTESGEGGGGEGDRGGREEGERWGERKEAGCETLETGRNPSLTFSFSTCLLSTQYIV